MASAIQEASAALHEVETISEDDEDGIANALERYRAAVEVLLKTKARSPKDLAARARIALKYEAMTGNGSFEDENPLAWDVLNAVAGR